MDFFFNPPSIIHVPRSTTARRPMATTAATPLDLTYYMEVDGKLIEMENSSIARISNFQNFELRFLAVYLNMVDSDVSSKEKRGFRGRYGDPSSETWTSTRELLEIQQDYEVKFSFGGRIKQRIDNVRTFMMKLCLGDRMEVYVQAKNLPQGINCPD